jgi:hypothetical protein
LPEPAFQYLIGVKELSLFAQRDSRKPEIPYLTIVEQFAERLFKNEVLCGDAIETVPTGLIEIIAKADFELVRVWLRAIRSAIIPDVPDQYDLTEYDEPVDGDLRPLETAFRSFRRVAGLPGNAILTKAQRTPSLRAKNFWANYIAKALASNEFCTLPPNISSGIAFFGVPPPKPPPGLTGPSSIYFYDFEETKERLFYLVQQVRDLIRSDIDFGDSSVDRIKEILAVSETLSNIQITDPRYSDSIRDSLHATLVVSVYASGTVKVDDVKTMRTAVREVTPVPPDFVNRYIQTLKVEHFQGTSFDSAAALQMLKGCMSRVTLTADYPSLQVKGPLLRCIHSSLVQFNPGEEFAKFREWFFSMGNVPWLPAQLMMFASLDAKDSRLKEYFDTLLHLADPYDAQPYALYSVLEVITMKLNSIPGRLSRDEFAKLVRDTIVGDVIVCNSNAASSLHRHRGFFNPELKLLIRLERNPLESIAHRIWSAFSLEESPLLHWFVGFLGFSKEFSFVPDLLSLMWRLRMRFADCPAVLGAVLHCTSLVDGSSLLRLQDIALASDVRDLQVLQCEGRKTAYSQIHFLLERFVNTYNQYIAALPAQHAVQSRPAWEMHPRMILQFANLEHILASAVLQTSNSGGSIEKLLEVMLKFPVPLCRFDFPGKDEKDLFGFAPSEWKKVFGFAKGLKHTMGISGTSFESPKAIGLVPDAKYAIIGPILAMYARDSKDYTKDFSDELAQSSYYLSVKGVVEKKETKMRLNSYPTIFRSDELLELLPDKLREALVQAGK